MVVLPAASRPTISIRICFLPNSRVSTLLIVRPIFPTSRSASRSVKAELRAELQKEVARHETDDGEISVIREKIQQFSTLFSFIRLIMTKYLIQLTCTDRRVPRLSPRRLWQQHTQKSTANSKRHLATGGAKPPEIVGKIRHARHTRMLQIGKLPINSRPRHSFFTNADRISPLFGAISRQNRGDHHAENDKARLPLSHHEKLVARCCQLVCM